MNPALSQEFHLFCEQEQLQKHATLDKNPYCVYGTLNPDANSVLLRAHLCTAVDSLRRKPCVEIVQESVKVCTTEMSSKILYAQHPVTKNLHISPRFSPAIFYRDANSVLLRAHLCTTVDAMRRKRYVRNCSREREGLYGECPAEPFMRSILSLRIFTSLPGSRLGLFITMQI